MGNKVKFKKGTLDAYNTALTDDNTLYVIPGTDDTSGRIYLGSHKVGDELKPANNNRLGGVKARLKTATDTAPVAIDTDGKLYTKQFVEEQYVLPQMTDTKLGGGKANPVNLALPVSLPNAKYEKVCVNNNGLLIAEKTIMTNTIPGVAKAAPKTATHTEAIGIDTDGKLYSKATPIMNANTIGGGKANPVNLTLPIPFPNAKYEKVCVNNNGLLIAEKTMMTATIPGVAKAIAKTASQSKKVAIDSNGNLYSEYPGIADNTKVGLVKSYTSPTSQGVGDYIFPVYVDPMSGLMRAKGATCDEKYLTTSMAVPLNSWKDIFTYNNNFPTGKFILYASVCFKFNTSSSTGIQVCLKFQQGTKQPSKGNDIGGVNITWRDMDGGGIFLIPPQSSDYHTVNIICRLGNDANSNSLKLSIMSENAMTVMGTTPLIVHPTKLLIFHFS